MNQTDDFLIQWIECGNRVVKTLDGAVLVSNAISLFEFLLQPGHQCAAASRTAPWCTNLDCRSNHLRGLKRVGVSRYICKVCGEELTGSTSAIFAHRRTH